MRGTRRAGRPTLRVADAINENVFAASRGHAEIRKSRRLTSDKDTRSRARDAGLEFPLSGRLVSVVRDGVSARSVPSLFLLSFFLSSRDLYGASRRRTLIRS